MFENRGPAGSKVVLDGDGTFWRAAQQKITRGKCARNSGVLDAVEPSKCFARKRLGFWRERNMGGIIGAGVLDDAQVRRNSRVVQDQVF